MIQQILIKLGCVFIATLICTLSTFLFGPTSLAGIAGGSLTLVLVLFCEKFGILEE